MYYDIDESIARRAHEMMSMTDYQPGSQTAQYRKQVDAAADLVARKKQKVSSFYNEKLDNLLDSYARVLALYYNRANEIGTRCPSVMIAGPANFPVRKKEKQVNAWEANRANYEKAQHILEQIRGVGTGPIDFADPHAHEMLQERVIQLLEQSEKAKRMNAHWRKYHTFSGLDGISDDQAARMDAKQNEIEKQIPSVKQPFPSYELSSIRNRLHAAQDRLKEYEARQAAPKGSTKFDGGEIVRNVELNRLQILFDEKPNDEQRDRLKEYGFRWSPKNSAWQRQLTQNAERAALQALDLGTK